MEFTAQQIAELIKGEVFGEPKLTVIGFGKIEEAKKNELTFLANRKYLSLLKDTNASIVILSKEFKENIDASKTYILVEDAYVSMAKLLQLYESMLPTKTGIENPSFVSSEVSVDIEGLYIGAFSYISAGVKLGKNTKIHPQVFIGENVNIGDNVHIFPGVKIYANCIIGNNVIIQSNSVIGCEGFGYQPDDQGVYSKTPQLGNVIIGDDVEIGACSTIDRATMGSTIIQKGTKLDNQIQIAHNVNVGKHNVIAAQSGVAGSTKIGDHNLIGGQVGITGHLKIGNQIQIQAQSGVNYDVKDNEKLYGSPAFSAMDYRKSYVHFKNFNKIVQRLNILEKKLKENSNG